MVTDASVCSVLPFHAPVMDRPVLPLCAAARVGRRHQRCQVGGRQRSSPR